jgi:hypothetical protein
LEASAELNTLPGPGGTKTNTNPSSLFTNEIRKGQPLKKEAHLFRKQTRHCFVFPTSPAAMFSGFSQTSHSALDIHGVHVVGFIL